MTSLVARLVFQTKILSFSGSGPSRHRLSSRRPEQQRSGYNCCSLQRQTFSCWAKYLVKRNLVKCRPDRRHFKKDTRSKHF